MKFAALLLLVALPLNVSAQWKPPEKPDPSAILQEAVADTGANRYEDALAKHVWFHHEALKHAPAQYGVRLSFALSYWQKLGEVYPPAVAKLKEIRDETKQQLTKAQGKTARDLFLDLASINQRLKEDADTKAFFTSLDKENPKLAHEVFSIARPALIESKEYKLCGKYLEPNSQLTSSIAAFHNVPSSKRNRDFAEKKFTHDTATLVGLLVLNDRAEEAREVATKVKKEWDDKSFHAVIDRALGGELPKRWPYFTGGK